MVLAYSRYAEPSQTRVFFCETADRIINVLILAHLGGAQE
jgi:hypothetical protein